MIKEGVLVAVRGKMIYVKTDDGFQEIKNTPHAIHDIPRKA